MPPNTPLHELRSATFPTPCRLGILGCREWGDDYRSGCSNEDLPSNSAGADFGRYTMKVKPIILGLLETTFFIIAFMAIAPVQSSDPRLDPPPSPILQGIVGAVCFGIFLHCLSKRLTVQYGFGRAVINTLYAAAFGFFGIGVNVAMPN